MGILSGAINGIGSLVGLGGGQGQYYQNAPMQSKASDAINANISNLNDPKINGIISDYSQGKMSLNDALSQLKGSTGNLSSAYGQLATSPLAGSMVASDQVRNDPTLSGLYGQGGAMESAEAQNKDLSSRGYSLQPEDYEAYGQGSGNIARMFGTQEQSLAQSLSNRGLGGAGSGVANQQFSGLQGNKFEQLGQLQQQIAQQRMQSNLARLTANQNFLTQMGQGATQAEGQKFNENLSGVQNQQGMLSSAAGQDISRYGTEANAAQASDASRKAAMQPSLMDAIGLGVGKAVAAGPSILMGGPAAAKNDITKGNQAGTPTSTYPGILA